MFDQQLNSLVHFRETFEEDIRFLPRKHQILIIHISFQFYMYNREGNKLIITSIAATACAHFPVVFINNFICTS